VSDKPAPNTPAPAGSYALPGGGPGGADAYPINTKGRAVSALARVEQDGTPEEKAKVRDAVAKAYPGLPSSQGKGGSAAAAHNAAKKGVSPDDNGATGPQPHDAVRQHFGR
jgi:hypothetical protein